MFWVYAALEILDRFCTNWWTMLVAAFIVGTPCWLLWLLAEYLGL